MKFYKWCVDNDILCVIYLIKKIEQIIDIKKIEMTRLECPMLSILSSIRVQFDQPSPVRKTVMCNLTYMYMHYLVTGTSGESDTNVSINSCRPQVSNVLLCSCKFIWYASASNSCVFENSLNRLRHCLSKLVGL